MNRELNWALIGCGVIANEMASGMVNMGRTFYGVANRTYDKAAAFAEKYGVGKVYDTIDDIFTDPDVDIVYIATPHNTHYGFMKKALKSGKHILVEKAITLNSKELDEMISLAKENDLMIGEAQTIWHMPIYKKLHEIVDSGEIGKVQIINVYFGSFKEYDMNNRYFNMNLAGGALLDIGVYALSEIRTFLSEKPDEVLAQWKPSPAGSDEMVTVLLKTCSGQLAAATISLHSKQPKRAVISCEKGYIEIMEYPRAEEALIVNAATGEKRKITAGNSAEALQYEVRDMEHAVRTGDSSVLRINETKDVMDIMTKLRYEWGLKYPEEK